MVVVQHFAFISAALCSSMTNYVFLFLLSGDPDVVGQADKYMEIDHLL